MDMGLEIIHGIGALVLLTALIFAVLHYQFRNKRAVRTGGEVFHSRGAAGVAPLPTSSLDQRWIILCIAGAWRSLESRPWRAPAGTRPRSSAVSVTSALPRFSSSRFRTGFAG